jgi:uncharacterized protein RhaS with RHS repeats
VDAFVRYYDPVAGRFLSTDPVLTDENSAAHFNRYTYALNNPYKYIDPDGRLPFLVPVAIFLLKEAAAEVASHYTGGASDFLSVRRSAQNVGGFALKKMAHAVDGAVADLAKHKTADITKSAGQLGREGEAAASAITGVGKNTEKFLVNGRTRIPDQVNASNIATGNPLHVTEVKNVGSQSYTQQLRDNVDLVGGVGGGGRVDVIVRQNTKVSGPLQEAHNNPDNPINIRREL